MCTGCLKNIQISQIVSKSRIYSYTSLWCDSKYLKQLSHVHSPTCARIYMFIFPTLRADSHGSLLSHYLACICWIPGHLQSWEASAPRAWPAWWGWRARGACARSGWVSPSYKGSDWASCPVHSLNPNLSKEQDIYPLGSSPSIFGEKKKRRHTRTRNDMVSHTDPPSLLLGLSLLYSQHYDVQSNTK